MFIDKYLVEAFAHDRQAILFPHFSDPADVHVALFADGGEIAADVAGWRMNTIYGSNADG